MQSLAIKRIIANDVGPFSSLDVQFCTKPGIMLICGDNGIGKSTVLEIIASAFINGHPTRLKKKAGSDVGYFRLNIERNGIENEADAHLKNFAPEDNDWPHLFGLMADSIINVKVGRDFSYQRRESISRDPDYDPNRARMQAYNGLNASEIKPWFSNRFLLEPHGKSGGWTDDMQKNLATARKFFSIIDPSVVLKSVDVRSFDIYVDTPSGTVPFEYLSSGFRSAYVLLLGILKEIEYSGLNVSAEDFSGVILIDEVDLHLHPTWQRKIGKILSDAFPKAQIIATTHSPHVIQMADASQVIALYQDENGTVSQRQNPSVEYGYSGWTIDEVLEDVMGVPETKSPEYLDAIAAFDHAMDSENAQEVVRTRQVLRSMLHPRNPYLKLIEIQAAPVIGDVA